MKTEIRNGKKITTFPNGGRIEEVISDNPSVGQETPQPSVMDKLNEIEKDIVEIKELLKQGGGKIV